MTLILEMSNKEKTMNTEVKSASAKCQHMGIKAVLRYHISHMFLFEM